MPSPLQQLDRSNVEVELRIGDVTRTVSGEARFDEADPELGRVLRISVKDPAGNFELLLREAEWNGTLQASERAGCDYRISLVNREPCPR